MKEFPAEFADLLNPRGRRILERGPHESTWRGNARLSVFTGLIDAAKARHCQAMLESALSHHVRPMQSRIAPERTWGLKRNYTEQLAKTMRQGNVSLASPRSRAYEAAREIGLVRMLRSDTLARFAEMVTRHRLERRNGMQVIRYVEGDYVGPHNDHHPEEPHLRHGYVDVHLSFVNQAVASQQLVCEDEQGFLNVPFDVTRNGCIAVYELPFWHYVTPLVGKAGREKEARRWLAMASYTISK